MTDLYACANCGTVRVDDTRCRVCTHDYFESVESDDGDEDDDYPCPECDETFDTQQGLSSHSRVHDDDDE